MPASPQDAVIRGRTLAERRAERDRVESYPPEKLAQNVARAKKEARLKEQREEREEDARRAKRQEDMNAPLWKVWGLLRPTLASAFKDEFEMTLMLAICVVRYVELRLQTQVTRTLFGTLNSRNRAVFNQGILRSAYVSVGAAILDIIYNYLQQRLNWKWRKKLTDLLHEKYFANFAYYYIGAGGGRGVNKMSDPDTRITNDLSATVNGFTNCFSRAMNSSLTGVVYTFMMLSERNIWFALAPYAYLLVSRAICQQIIPMRKIWRRNGRARGVSWGKYRFALQRQEMQGEAIGALRGSEREMEIIIDEFAVHVEDCHKHHWDFLTFHSAWNFFIIQGGNALVDIVCIGEKLIFPGKSANAAGGIEIDSIDQMATTLADVKTHMMLYRNTLDAARTAVQLVTELQQLIGHVERVTELAELLETVSEAADHEQSKSIVPEDCIAFEGVDIVTPQDVELVRGLSFRLNPGDSLLIVGHNGAGKR